MEVPRHRQQPLREGEGLEVVEVCSLCLLQVDPVTQRQLVAQPAQSVVRVASLADDLPPVLLELFVLLLEVLLDVLFAEHSVAHLCHEEALQEAVEWDRHQAEEDVAMVGGEGDGETDCHVWLTRERK